MVGASCGSDGFWSVSSSVSVSSSSLNIDGLIHIQGDFHLASGASLLWQGLNTSELPTTFVAQSAKRNVAASLVTVSSSLITLSFVNVTGNVTLDGTVTVNLTSSDLDQIIGPVDSSQLTRTASQPIIESNNVVSGPTLDASVVPSQSCRKVGVGTGSSASTSNPTRSTLNAIFTIDDTGCNTKSNNLLVEIIVPVIVGVIVIILIIVILLSCRSETFKNIIRPYRARGETSAVRVRPTTTHGAGAGSQDQELMGAESPRSNSSDSSSAAHHGGPRITADSLHTSSQASSGSSVSDES